MIFLIFFMIDYHFYYQLFKTKQIMVTLTLSYDIFLRTSCWCFSLKAESLQPIAHWTASSVGSEHYLDRVGVAGSSPAQFT